MDFENLAPELQEKVRACTSAEELEALIAAEGIELSDEVLEGIAGGRPFACAKNVILLASSDCRKNTTPSPVC